MRMVGRAYQAVAFVGLLTLVAAGCGAEESPTLGPDQLTLSIEGSAPATYDDDMAEVSLLAGWNTDVPAGVNIDFYYTSPTGSGDLTLWIVLDAPLPTSLPGSATGSIVLIAGGFTYTNYAAAFTVTKLGHAMGDTVEGSFPTTVLTGPASTTLDVSGSFRATFINPGP